MGKILKSFKVENVTVKMSRQRSSYGSGWEYPVWVEISDKKEKGYGWQQDPRIYQSTTEADKYYDEVVQDMKSDLKQAVWIHAPQIQNHLE